MSGVPDDVLSGEVCRVTVEVLNCGQVPLNSLRITSSAAGRLLLDSTVSPEYMYTCTCFLVTTVEPGPLNNRHIGTDHLSMSL